MTTLECLLEFVRDADDAALMKSVKQCHAKNVSSIVIRNDDGSLFRAFLAWPGHPLADNRPGGNLAVGVHDHRYEVSLLKIVGDIENVTYERTTSGGFELDEWLFESGIESGVPVVTRVGRQRIAESRREQLLTSSYVTISADSLHDIECRGVCGWYVQEGCREKDRTTLFTSGSVSTDGPYERFKSRTDVVSHVLQWCFLAAEQWVHSQRESLLPDTPNSQWS